MIGLRLPAPRPVEPRKLRQALRRARAQADSGSSFNAEDHFPRAICELDKSMRLGIDPVLTRKELNALIRLYERLESPEQQSTVAVDVKIVVASTC